MCYSFLNYAILFYTSYVRRRLCYPSMLIYHPTLSVYMLLVSCYVDVTL